MTCDILTHTHSLTDTLTLILALSQTHTHTHHSGEDRGYSERALLIYDGIHYDPLVLEGKEGLVLQKLFAITEQWVLTKASELAREAFQVCVCVCVCV